MQITYVHDFEGFSSCGFLPTFIRFVFYNILELCSNVSLEILFGAEVKFMTNFMGIEILDPDGVDDGINHLCNGALADNFIFDMFFFAVVKTNAREENIERSFWHGFSCFVDHEMTGLASRRYGLS